METTILKNKTQEEAIKTLLGHFAIVCEDRISAIKEDRSDMFCNCDLENGDCEDCEHWSDGVKNFRLYLNDIEYYEKKWGNVVSKSQSSGIKGMTNKKNISKVIVKSYIETILQEIVDAGYLYAVTYDGEEFSTEATDDVSKGFGKDEYKGVHAYDDSYILVLNKDESVLPHVKEGWIRWTNCNDGIEKVIDYTTNLDEKIGFDSLTEKWEKERNELIKNL